MVRALRRGDLDAVLRLNEEHEDELSPLDAGELAALVDLSLAAWVAEHDGAVIGFAIALAPRTAYGSRNYRWFDERYDDFVYLDRIAVDAGVRRRGIAGRLYDELQLVARQRGTIVACEVNLVPRNDPSLSFHASRGFRPVGELEHDGGKVVRMLVLDDRGD